jgi:hypothetical protein
MTPEQKYNLITTAIAIGAVVASLGYAATLVHDAEPVTDVPTPDVPTPDLRNVGWQRVESPRVDVECFRSDSTIVCLSVLGC